MKNKAPLRNRNVAASQSPGPPLLNGAEAAEPATFGDTAGMSQEEKKGAEEFGAHVEVAEAATTFGDEVPTGYMTLDAGGYIKQINTAACVFLNREAALLRNASFIQFVAHSDITVFAAYLERCQQMSPSTATVELRLATSPESVVELVARSVCHGIPPEVTYHVVLNDRTALHNMVELMQEKEERFRTLAGATFEGIVFSEEGRIIEANQQFAEMVGYELSELTGFGIASLVVPEHRERVMKYILAGKDVVHEHDVIRKDGRRISVEAHGRPMYYRGRLVRVTAVRDVTERRRAEEELRRSEQIYRAVGESINYGVWICDPGGRNIYASPSFLSLVGMTQEQCSEFGWGDVLHPDDAAATIAAWKECAASGSFWERYHRYRGVDGRYHHVLARGVPVRDENGTVICWAGINLDVDDIKMTEEALRQSEERLRYHMENSPLAVVEWDKDFTVTRWSKEAERMFGWKSSEVRGMPLGQMAIVYEDDIPIVLRTMERLSSGNERAVVAENRSITKDGRIISCVWYNSVLTDMGGKVASILSLVQDVTEERKARESLEKTLESVRVLVASSQESMVLVDSDGRIRCLSGRAAQTLGAPPAELEGMSCMQFLPQDQIIRARYYYADLVRNPESPLSTTVQLRIPGERMGWFSLSVSSVALGDSRGYLVTIERLGDVEEIKRPSDTQQAKR